MSGTYVVRSTVSALTSSFVLSKYIGNPESAARVRLAKMKTAAHSVARRRNLFISPLQSSVQASDAPLRGLLQTGVVFFSFPNLSTVSWLVVGVIRAIRRRISTL